ncbi:MAG: ABC transporter permease [Desulfobacter sp.]
MRHVVHAVIFRELKTRFGDYRLGYLWLVLEPVSHLLVWMAVLGAASRHVIPGVDFPVFLAVGILPWIFISNSISRSLTAVESNSSLFTYRRVKPIDIMIARVLIELVAVVMVGILLVSVAWLLGFKISVQNGLLFVGYSFVTFFFTLALSMITGIAAVLIPSSKKIIPMIMRPFYFISAIMYPFAVVPQYKRHWLDWNPVLHIVELLRNAWFGPALKPTITSWVYLLSVTLLIMAASLWLYRISERRLLTTV